MESGRGERSEGEDILMRTACMRNILGRVKGAVGETLVETLVALMVSALAMAMVAMAVTVATNIVGQSKQALGDRYHAGNEVVAQSEHRSPSSGWSVSVSGALGEGLDATPVSDSVDGIAVYEDDVDAVEIQSYDYVAGP